jgi:hypothetical protein
VVHLLLGSVKAILSSFPRFNSCTKQITVINPAPHSDGIVVGHHVDGVLVLIDALVNGVNLLQHSCFPGVVYFFSVGLPVAVSNLFPWHQSASLCHHD